METKPAERKGKRRRALLLRWIALWPLTLGLLLYPVSNGILRCATVLAIATLWAGGVWFSWRVKWLRMTLIGVPLLAASFVLLPGQKVSPTSLRQDYVGCLLSYEGTRYVWGGENRLGIDCSGLVRGALINSSAQQSLQTFNPALMRFALDVWWHDCSARALSEEYRRRTIKLFEIQAINDIEADRIHPGDLAVTEDGVHVMAFLGGSNWIEADPDIKRVVIVTVPSTNVWFDTPVKLLRWRVLDQSL